MLRSNTKRTAIAMFHSREALCCLFPLSLLIPSWVGAQWLCKTNDISQLSEQNPELQFAVYVKYWLHKVSRGVASPGDFSATLQ